jgi:glycogen operon protein
MNPEAPIYAYRGGRHASDLAPDGRDDAWGKPRSVVIDASFDWERDQRLSTPWANTIIYEAHIKGFTELNTDVPPNLRGTYRGFTHPAVVAHFQDLGVTAIELLPVHAFVDDDFLVRRGLRNFWGYKTLGYFAPEARYSSAGNGGEQVREFKEMVKALHRAGLEVILDVVYNHTAESGSFGPTLSYRGIDNVVYYRLFQPEKRFYDDVTGTGNTLNAAHPQVRRLILDSLRYWVEDMHIDGFRFDLAPALARDEHGFSKDSPLFQAIQRDPILSTVKLIAEPWDLGDGGYRLGDFPSGWSEWNDRFRNAARRFWKGDLGMVAELSARVSGSEDIFASSGRSHYASINFVTAHDGFTLMDLVSYERKHNLDNGELNRDGSDYNASWNHGTEGESNDPTINLMRLRDIKNLIGTLLLSRGVPMLLAGDEFGRTQLGNNNAYCQDNPISWLSWQHSEESSQLCDYLKSVIELRKSLSTLWMSETSQSQSAESARRTAKLIRPKDDLVATSSVSLMEKPSFGIWMRADRTGTNSVRSAEDEIFLALNADNRPAAFCLPGATSKRRAWKCELSTSDETSDHNRILTAGTEISVEPHCLMVFVPFVPNTLSCFERSKN